MGLLKNLSWPFLRTALTLVPGENSFKTLSQCEQNQAKRLPGVLVSVVALPGFQSSSKLVEAVMVRDSSWET